MQNDNIFLKTLTKRTDMQVCKVKIGGTHFLILEENFKEANLVSIFLMQKEQFLERFFVSELVVEDGRFYADRIFFDSVGHTDRVAYFLEKDHVVREISDYSQKKNCKKFSALIPVYFFESVKAENLDEARGYLCKDLQEVEDGYFFDYFKEYSHLVFEDEKYYLLGEVKNEISFETDGNKIINFEIT